MFGLKYTEEFDPAAPYPFKNRWIEAHVWLFLCNTLLSFGAGYLVLTVFGAQPFLAILIAVLSSIVYLYLSKIQRRIQEISDTKP